MKVPEYIRQKMHRAAKLHAEASRIIRQVDEYFEGRGYTPENLRCGDGFSLEELDYGNDVTDIFVERIESGEFREPPEGEEETRFPKMYRCLIQIPNTSRPERRAEGEEETP